MDTLSSLDIVWRDLIFPKSMCLTLSEDKDKDGGGVRELMEGMGGKE